MSSPLGVGRRIGLVCPYSLSTPGGVQNHVIGLAGHLVREGHRPQILAPGRPDPDTLARHGLTPAQVTTAGFGVPVRYNGSVARVNFGPRVARRVRRWLDRGRFDLVHLHEPITPSIALLALWLTRAPVVATFHTANPSSRTMHLAGRVLSRTIDKIDARIAVSQTARSMVRRHLDRDTAVISNGFAFAEFARAPIRQRPPTHRPRIVFLGRLNEARKGLDVLLAALPRLQAALPGLEVLVAGEGHRRLPAPCRPLGRVSDADRADLLAGADVFVAPHTSRESFGLVLIEALAAGAPVVAADLAAFVDVITARGRGKPPAGWLFPVGHADALADQLLQCLATDPAELARLRAEGRALTRRYDWSAIGPAIEQVYADTLAGAAQQPAPTVRRQLVAQHGLPERQPIEAFGRFTT